MLDLLKLEVLEVRAVDELPGLGAEKWTRGLWRKKKCS